jgi:hypothetical protein
MRDLALRMAVWGLLLERLWLACAFVFADLRFLLFQRRAIRRRIATLVERHGACTATRKGATQSGG